MSESLEKELFWLQAGKLTLDPVAARRRLAEFEMPDPEMWLARALEAPTTNVRELAYPRLERCILR